MVVPLAARTAGSSQAIAAWDAEAAKEALRDAIDLADLRSQAQAAGLDPDEVVAGYKALRDSQVSPDGVLKMLKRAAITD
jgi:hypothetical protein